ncbi:hypothetical protein F5Y17DRAFT_208006 [Xylariaceae sp. FL0594]|nr:hypothetical protein F5Y17DRAFT_208006 [Xylariaceae sp. FL0594]
MTIEPGRPAQSGRGCNLADDDILAALWETAPFPKLPHDAPPEMKELIVDIENPKRVYTVHCAYRRHGLQLLIDQFVLQLRYGCGDSNCSTTTCFTFRKKAAGRVPIRRYNPNSARTLAVYLASQDNPRSRLCPYLRPSSGPSDSILPLHFTAKTPSTRERVKARLPHVRDGASVAEPPVSKAVPTQGGTGSSQTRDLFSNNDVAGTPPLVTSSNPVQGKIVERPIGKKDYRSFAAAVFGTVAFKMVEWLAPKNLEALAKNVEASQSLGQSAQSPASSWPEEKEVESSVLHEPLCDSPRVSVPGTHPGVAAHSSAVGAATGVSGDRLPVESRTRSPPPRRKSSAKIRTSSGTQPKVFVEPLVDSADETVFGSPEKMPKVIVRPSSTLRCSSPPSRNISSTFHADSDGADAARSDSTEEDSLLETKDNETVSSGGVNSRPALFPSDGSVPSIDLQPASELATHLPQSLSRLSIETVNFLCDVLQEDGTTEPHLLQPRTVDKSLQRHRSRHRAWKRRRKGQVSYPQSLKYEWKLFVEQSIFNVLSDPQAVLESFTGTEGVLDSQAIWYCMFRLTRAAPRVVFDSLWIALEGLFAPPKSLRSPAPSKAKVSGSPPKSFSNAETASLLAICFHALVAAAPLVTDSRHLFDISRLRSRGLILSGSRGSTQELSLQYEDAFTDDLALRLARRLLMVIPTRRCFDELAELDLELLDGKKEEDVLDTLLSYIEPPTHSSLRFTKSERSIHEKRVPILLLDWARAVMIREWTGQPVVPGDGPFGGALMLIAAMYRKRQSLLLGDAHFRSEFFGERLDSLDMAVSWLSFTPTRQKVHLLDFPFIFNPASLVTYFRAINLSIMSRSYEEGSSLQLRVRMLAESGSLITSPHQRSALGDLLRIAASKYLILHVRRDEVLMDTFDQLWRREERELLRPLKVHLGEDTGEEGFDSGGVQQEFFRMAISEALDPDKGAFTVDERTRMTWFQPGSLQPAWRYELMGLLVSLAVFNGLTLPVTFPKALYQKLLGEPVTELHHIADGWPDLANGLTNLLEWNEKDGSVEDVFVLTYEFSTSMLGQPVSRRMEPPAQGSWPQFSRYSDEPPSAGNPADAPAVTGDNRNAYVSDYIRYLTDVSVAPQFEAFARGFRTCLQPKSLTLLTPSLLQSLVEGTQEIDIAELRRVTRYVGWDANHHTVREFWSVVKKFDEGMRRKLLEFVTASDRVPVGGVANIQFVIQKNGEEEGEGGHLPTAYTCYGTLLLPEYRDKKVLQERLSMALQNAQGFGFA